MSEELDNLETSIDSLLPTTTFVPTQIIPAGSNTPVAYSEPESYGHTLRFSNMCTICRHVKLSDINKARAQVFKSYSDISKEYNLPQEALRKHFENHYMISEIVHSFYF